MRNKNTSIRIPKAGRPKRAGNKNRKTFSPGISANYRIMLELYCINKKEAVAKKELKHQRLRLRRSVNPAQKSSYSITAAIISFFEESLLFLKKSKPGMAMAAVTE